jgi:hypothetical protein
MGRSPVYRSKGHSAVFTVEAAIALGARTALDVFVEHSDDGDEHWAVAGRFPSMTGSGVASLDVSGIKEFWRVASSLVGRAAQVRVLRPHWRGTD